MSNDDKSPATPEAFTHALEVFEIRNRAFRVLYDTVIEIQGGSATEVYEILNRNLRRLCDADCTALATFDENTSTFTLEAIAGNLDGEEFSSLRRATHTVPKDVVEELKIASVKECLEHERCLGSFFPVLISQNGKVKSKRHYRVSCVRGGKLLAAGLIRYDRDQKMPVRDLVDTYINLAGMVIQQVKARQAVVVSENRYRRLFEFNPLGIVMIDSEGMIKAANPASLCLTPQDSSFLTGRSFLETFIAPKEHDRVWAYLQQVGGKEGGGPALEVMGIATDSERRLRLSADPTHPIHQSSDGVIVCIEDVTRYKKMETELLRAQKLESVGVLAGGIAHDFNNLLTVILGSTSLLQAGVSSPFETQRLLEAVDQACQRARELTGKLLTFSKGGAPVKQVSPIGDLIEDAAVFSLSGANVDCQFDFPEDLLPAEVDPIQINQVVSNIVLNSIDAMPNGGSIKITATNEQVSATSDVPLPEGPYVRVNFSDQGPGIDDAILQQIFDPFFTTKENGTGLGLATVYSIVKQHGGLVTASSPSTGGTVFTLYLPAPDVAKVDATKPAKSGRNNKGRVLVVDDEKAILNLASMLLEQMELESITAIDGRSGVEIFRKEHSRGRPFDSVILDLTIPGGMGGTEALREILAIDPAARVIVSSGYSNAPVLERFRDFGFVGVLRKPYGAAEFIGVLQEVLGIPS